MKLQPPMVHPRHRTLSSTRSSHRGSTRTCLDESAGVRAHVRPHPGCELAEEAGGAHSCVEPNAPRNQLRQAGHKLGQGRGGGVPSTQVQGVCQGGRAGRRHAQGLEALSVQPHARCMLLDVVEARILPGSAVSRRSLNQTQFGQCRHLLPAFMQGRRNQGACQAGKQT